MKIISENKTVIKQFIIYGITAGVATLFDWGSFFLFYNRLGINEFIAAVFGFIIWFIVNYFLSIIFVFKKSKHKRGKEVTLVLVTSLIALGLNLLCLWAFIELFSVIPLIAENAFIVEHDLIPLCSRMAASVVSMVFNFVIRKVMIFAD